MDIRLTVAMSESDRTKTIMSGKEHIAPFRFEPQQVKIEDIFINQISDATYDIAELSLASYLISIGMGQTRLTAIPVFLSRSFRHNAIYVRADSPWTHPSQLKNRRFGFPEYQMTAAVWVRAFFRHEWGIANDEMQWVTFRPERVPIETPAERSSSDDIFDALVAGEVDAIMTARRPPAHLFTNTGEGGAIRRLFPNVWQEERNYFERTSFFPIMHLVSLKKETAEAYPELPRKLYDVMLKHKDEGVSQMLETIKNNTSAPFLWESVEQSMKLMQGDIWPYGLKNNRRLIETFVQYLQEDGLLKVNVTPEQMFHASVLDT